MRLAHGDTRAHAPASGVDSAADEAVPPVGHAPAVAARDPDGIAPVPHPAHGLHLLLTLSGCDRAILDDEARLRELTGRAARATGAQVLQVMGQRFVPAGVTVLALLAESHASLHTYPEAGTAFWDCFTCGDSCRPERGIAVLVETLRPARYERMVVERA